MKRTTKYKLMTGLLAGTVFVGGWKLGTVHALASNEKEPVFSISPTESTQETIVETPENINKKKLFRETNIYVGQNIKGVYSTTKFKAELICAFAQYSQ